MRGRQFFIAARLFEHDGRVALGEVLSLSPTLAESADLATLVALKDRGEITESTAAELGPSSALDFVAIETERGMHSSKIVDYDFDLKHYVIRPGAPILGLRPVRIRAVDIETIFLMPAFLLSPERFDPPALRR